MLKRFQVLREGEKGGGRGRRGQRERGGGRGEEGEGERGGEKERGGGEMERGGEEEKGVSDEILITYLKYKLILSNKSN